MLTGDAEHCATEEANARSGGGSAMVEDVSTRRAWRACAPPALLLLELRRGRAASLRVLVFPALARRRGPPTPASARAAM